MSCCQPAGAGAGHDRPSAAALVAAAVLAVNSMSLALATNLNPLTPAQRAWAHLLLLTLALGNLALLGRPLAAAVRRAGLRSVAGLFSLCLLGALGFSVASTWRGTGPVYYEVVSILLVVYSAGRALTAMAQNRVLQELGKLTLQGEVVAVRRGEGPFADMLVAAIAPGDAFVVRPGGVIVVDGEVVRGSGYVQTASLTGESQLRRVAPGDGVLASWFCADASLLVRATRAGNDRAIDAVAAAVAQVAARQEPRPSQVEGVAAVFAPVVMAVAAVTFVAWAWAGPWDVAMLNALAVCLVACPCALGFAVPIGLRAGTLRLAAAGVVVRQGAALETLSRVNSVVFDKTGTLTHLHIDAAQTLACSPGWTPQQLLGLAASAQSLVHHPISEAFAPWAHLAPVGWQPLAAQLLPGCGIAVTMMGPDGEHLVGLGDPALLCPAQQEPLGAAAMRARGHKPLALLLDHTCLALFALTDSPFVPPRALADALARRKIQTAVLSGDGEVAVRALGLADARATCTPLQKLRHVEQLQTCRRVCYVGDGINDGAALGAADVAVAMQSGADLSRELADLILPAGRPETLVLAIDVARCTTRLIRQNLAISLAYNAVGMAVAAAGLLGPVAASLLMAASSLTVCARSLATLRPSAGPQGQGNRREFARPQTPATARAQARTA